MSDKTTIDSPSPAYALMAERWEPIEAVNGGTHKMRADAETWLKREKGEEKTDYTNRLNRSVLFGGLRSAVRRISAKPFSHSVTVAGEDTLPDQLQWMLEDVDRSGTNLTTFSRLLFEDALRFGKSHFLIDYPSLPDVPRLDVQMDEQIRPYWSHVPATALIGWRSHRAESGAEILDEIRIRSDRYEAAEDNRWSDDLVRSVTVYRRESNGIVTWERWEMPPDAKAFELQDENSGIMLGMSEIPLVPVYFDRTGFLEAQSPLEDLAWTEIAHWQSNSDQRNILRYARVPMPFATGVDHETMEEETQIGAARMFKSTNPDARFGFVEPAGAAIAAGEADLRHLEERMEALGSAPLMRRSGAVTATSKAIDEGGISTDAQAWTRALSNALTEGLWWAGQWIGYEVPEDVTPSVYSEFSLMGGRVDDIKALQVDAGSGRITKERYLIESRRRGLYGEDMDPATEVAMAEAETPAMVGVIGQDDDQDDFTDDGDDDDQGE